MPQIEKDIQIILIYLPDIFNLIELSEKLCDVCGIYNKKLLRNEYKVSNQTLYKYLNKYCKKLSKGQWEKRN